MVVNSINVCDVKHLGGGFMKYNNVNTHTHTHQVLCTSPMEKL